MTSEPDATTREGAGRFTATGADGELASWFEQVLGDREHGPVELVRDRFWSLLLRADTPDGPVWAKANHPAQAFEAAALGVLDRAAPGLVPAPIVVDPGRGFLATRDFGATLRESEGALDWNRGQQVLQAAADLADASAPVVTALVSAGMSVVTEELLTTTVTEAVRASASTSIGHPAHLTDDEASAAIDALPGARERLRALQESVVPWSLEHSDLHSNNCFRRSDGRIGLFDLGDAVIGHPFATVSCVLDEVIDPDPVCERDQLDPRLQPFSAGHLQRFARYAELPVLWAELDAAARFRCVHRLISWQRLLADLPPRRWPSYSGSVRHWLLQVSALA